MSARARERPANDCLTGVTDPSLRSDRPREESYQGQTYRVDASGQYRVLASDGWWYPLQPR